MTDSNRCSWEKNKLCCILAVEYLIRPGGVYIDFNTMASVA